MKYVLIVLSFMICSINAAELPEKGIDPPAIILGPDPRPDNPDAPVGNGLFVVLGFGVLYAIKKRKE